VVSQKKKKKTNPPKQKSCGVGDPSRRGKSTRHEGKVCFSSARKEQRRMNGSNKEGANGHRNELGCE